MGCAIPTGCREAVTMFCSKSSDSADMKQKLERKFYIARETPEPIFDLSECGLKQVPAGVFSLCKVFRKETLDLDDNLLHNLDSGGFLSDLYLLKALKLSNNKFQRLDDNFSLLVNLKELYLSHNELKYLPDSLGELNSLQVLDVSNNQLKKLPSSIGNLKKLRNLSLRNNPSLRTICDELCGAQNLISLSVDSNVISSPPSDVCMQGVESIMRYLCNKLSIEYIVPQDVLPTDSPIVQSPGSIDPFKRRDSKSWEDQDKHLLQLENQLHEAAKLQRRQFLEDFTQEQTKLDAEVFKIQTEKEAERMKLVAQIQEEETAVEETVKKLLEISESTPQRMQQMFEYEQKEHDRLLNVFRENYSNAKKTETLKAMESFIEEECLRTESLKKYGENLTEIRQSVLIQELDSTEKLSDLLKIKDESHSDLVRQLLEDEDVQKAAVASLLEKCDSRAWSLVQEINIVEANLAKLSAIEMNKRKLANDHNIGNLAEQRLQLSCLLVDLLEQQELRRSQLFGTLIEMEKSGQPSADFWLISYQRLLESVPSTFLNATRKLDPVFANYLLQEGVIHCLPFLVKYVFEGDSLSDLTSEELKSCGVTLNSDRLAILRAIQFYIEDVKGLKETQAPSLLPPAEPSAPPSRELQECSASTGEVLASTECAICLDRSCEVVFVPCGHLCCCTQCSDTVETLCPLCRTHIERRIRVII